MRRARAALVPASAGLGRRDLGLLALIAVFPLGLFGAVALSGRTYFWGDLTYIHFGWRALPAEQLARGVLPLWNPYAYLGMPMAGALQGGTWYPGTLPFYLLPFARALPVFHAAHFFLAGAFAFLWLRSLRLARAGAAAGAVLFMLGGLLAARIPFLNHLSTLAFFPALALFARRPALLGLSLALAFLGGYPTMLAGAAAAAWLLAAALGRGGRRLFGAREVPHGLPTRFACGAALAAALSAALLLPGLELAAHSRRGQGIAISEMLTWSFSPRDLLQWTAPALLAPGEFSPPVGWWKTAYLGLAGLLAVLAGALRLRVAAAAAAFAYLGGVALLILGGTNPLSAWVWEHARPLHWVRYPGNLAYLAAPALALLAALGAHRRRWARPAALVIGAELIYWAAASQPLVPADFFADPGPLTRVLQRELGGHRYLPSPLALQAATGLGSDRVAAARDLKHRLYGVTNMPYRLASVANFGEPLVPAASYAFMDFLFTRSGLAEAARWLGWADARVLLTRDRLPPGELGYLGDSLWHLYRNPGPVERAFWFEAADGAAIPARAGEPVPELARATPLAVAREREDRFAVAGEFGRPGWLYVAEPLFPGWRVRGPGGRLLPEPALGAFQKLRVPAGSWTVRFEYRPGSWRLGRAISLAALALLAAYWFRRLRFWNNHAVFCR